MRFTTTTCATLGAIITMIFAGFAHAGIHPCNNALLHKTDMQTTNPLLTDVDEADDDLFDNIFGNNTSPGVLAHGSAHCCTDSSCSTCSQTTCATKKCSAASEVSNTDHHLPPYNPCVELPKAN
ncbi:hypothetical protein B0H66DRAFT_609995 [Apodospora peruviana]|uniref:Uncharacterized protein n=1 Tax=Apodospora peruviana TaxID=516989 RepID=A0AAE0IQH8_9PEZI|nr:hypothetical protein B0H66DRAFT_609995 [Apodospora peruviana]